MILRYRVSADDLARFPRLRAVCRMGVGYDVIDRSAAAERQIMVLNVPDYGTTEVADHAISLALALRRGLLLHHELQRKDPPAAWRYVLDPLVRRSSVQTFGIIGMGRIGTAVALRAKAFGFRVVFFDPHLPNGVELGLGIGRAPTLEALLRATDTLSVHAPLTPETRGLVGAAELALLPKDAVVVNTARGPIVDIDALAAALRSGHLAGVGIDVVPVEPPVEPVPELHPRLSCARTMGRRPPDHHPARGVLLAGSLGRHPRKISRDDARRAVGPESAERHSAGGMVKQTSRPSRQAHRHSRAGENPGATTPGNNVRVVAGA